jgi:radical SAM/Cys-rich protein
MGVRYLLQNQSLSEHPSPSEFFQALTRASMNATTYLPCASFSIATPLEKAKAAPKKFDVSLIAETLREMEEDEEFKLTAAKLKEFGQVKLTLQEKKRLRRSLADLGLPTFDEICEKEDVKIERAPTSILQLNIGLYCNQACSHCHVESSPKRKEMMSREVADKCIELAAASDDITLIDITGGAPELCDEFRYVAKEMRALGKDVIDRCNLTVLTEPNQEDLAEFLAENGIKVVASMPCYSPKNVNQQRGNGVFDRSISGLQMLNRAGYGVGDDQLTLDLVYNPIGGFLPPDQGELEAAYKVELLKHFDIEFDNLYAFANMPIKRFADFLHRRNELDEYMDLLVRNFNPATVGGLMCSNTMSVSWNGSIHDCDFNQQLAMGIDDCNKPGLTVFDLSHPDEISQFPVATGEHCFGCTAGSGSSCQGATEDGGSPLA